VSVPLPGPVPPSHRHSLNHFLRPEISVGEGAQRLMRAGPQTRGGEGPRRRGLAGAEAAHRFTTSPDPADGLNGSDRVIPSFRGFKRTRDRRSGRLEEGPLRAFKTDPIARGAVRTRFPVRTAGAAEGPGPSGEQVARGQPVRRAQTTRRRDAGPSSALVPSRRSAPRPRFSSSPTGPGGRITGRSAPGPPPPPPSRSASAGHEIWRARTGRRPRS